MKKTDLLLSVAVAMVFGAVFGFLTLHAVPVKAVTCTPKAKKECISNIVYWYNSCGVLENLYQNCNTTNQICQNGQCANKTVTNNPSPAPVTSPSPVNQNQGNQNQPDSQGVSITMLAAKENSPAGWQKTINASGGDNLDIVLIIKNYSDTATDNLTLTTTIPDGVITTSNVKIDNVALGGPLSATVNLGTLDAKTSKVISFTGQVQPQTSPKLSQIGVSASGFNGSQDSDNITITVAMATTPNASTSQTSINTNNTNNTKSDTGFLGLARKNWYIWLAVLIVLIVIFVIIFRRLSSTT